MDPTIPWFSCRHSPITSRKFKLIPNVSQRLGEMIHQLMAVMRGWRYAEPFVAPRHGRIIDRLYLDTMFPQEKAGDQFAFLGISDRHRGDEIHYTVYFLPPRRVKSEPDAHKLVIGKC
jgi:hypothetical protein